MPLRRGLITGLTTALLVLAAAAPAAAATSLDVADTGRVRDGTAILRVSITCDPGWTVLEAHVSVSQDEQQSTGMSGIPGVECDGRAHRYEVQVAPQSGAFHRGPASVSPYLLLQRDGAETQSSGGAYTVRLNGPAR